MEVTLHPPPSDNPSELSFNQAEFDIQRRFATPFVVAPLNDGDALNDALIPTILARSKTAPSVSLSNRGGWQSADDFQDWSGPAGASLLAAAVRLASTLTAVDTPDGLILKSPEWRVSAWANINRNGHANDPHHHPAAFWSGVYWVDVGEDADGAAQGGQFEMQDPRGVLPSFYAPRLRYAIPGFLSAGGQDFFEPKAGVMALFPAWLVHAVRPYTGAHNRISVAFNLSV